MRARIALCLGLVLVLGAGASWAGISQGTCGVCQCLDDGSIPLCTQDMSAFAECVAACGSTNVNEFSGSNPLCTQIPGCPQFVGNIRAPAASAYGIAALFIGLAGIGAWRLRRSRAA
jgi:hypothetical protein